MPLDKNIHHPNPMQPPFPHPPLVFLFTTVPTSQASMVWSWSHRAKSRGVITTSFSVNGADVVPGLSEAEQCPQRRLDTMGLSPLPEMSLYSSLQRGDAKQVANRETEMVLGLSSLLCWKASVGRCVEELQRTASLVSLGISVWSCHLAVD